MSYPAGAQYDSLAPYNQKGLIEPDEPINIEERLDYLFQNVTQENYNEFLKEVEELKPDEVKDFNENYNSLFG